MLHLALTLPLLVPKVAGDNCAKVIDLDID